MENVLEYKGYHSIIEFDADDLVLHGKIEGINDLVSFEAETAGSIVEEFHNAVDEYLDLCKRIGKNPDKEYKGSFNVRVTPQIHKDASMRASKEGISLNTFIQRALEKELYGDIESTKSIMGFLSNIMNYSTAEMEKPDFSPKTFDAEQLWKN